VASAQGRFVLVGGQHHHFATKLRGGDGGHARQLTGADDAESRCVMGA
jgi:hypothetical protein